MNQLFTNVRNFWIRDKSFTFLLIVLCIYLFILIPLLSNDGFSKIVFLVCYYLLLTSSMPFLLRRDQKLIAYALVIVPFLFLVVELYFHNEWLQILTDVFIIFYCILLGGIILFRTFDRGNQAQRRIQGAIIVYLLAGLIFCLLFNTLSIISGGTAFNVVPSSHRREFLYFSLCTLTTVGYGDIVPIMPMARSLANLESLIGQLYPAVLIARLVAMELSH